MCGAYIGVDEYRSRLTVLQEKFAAPKVLSGANSTAERSVWHAAL
jgi:trimethyllysine dioxygenase